jgi:endonuclease/exonuclease/phosphatase family metal-dependent hydrolase
VRLATVNLLHGRSLEDGQVDVARLQTAAKLVAADVAGLQEVDRGQPRSHGLDLTAEFAAAMGATDWRFVPALIGTPGQQWRPALELEEPGPPAYGVGLVSRYPVLSWHNVRLPAARVRAPVLLPGTRRLLWLQDEPRVAIAAVVEAPGGVVTVASTHLSFVPGWNAAQLRRVCRALAQLPGPRYLIGDLNLPGRTAARVSGWRSLARTATYPASDPRAQLDHILTTDRTIRVRTVAALRMDISDHRALVVDL